MRIRAASWWGRDAADENVSAHEGGEEFRGGAVVPDGVDFYVGVRGKRDVEEGGHGGFGRGGVVADQGLRLMEQKGLCGFYFCILVSLLEILKIEISRKLSFRIFF